MHEGDSLESAMGRMSKRVKKTALRKLWRSLGYSFRESGWYFMARGTYKIAFRKFVGNRKVKQLQSPPFCSRGWRMTWRKKEEKGWVCAPQSSGAPSRRGEEIWWPRFHRVTDRGSFRKASEGFLIYPISFIPPPNAGKEPEATRWFFASFLLPFRLIGSRSISATKVKLAYGATESPRPAQHACQCIGKTPEHQNLWPI